jgi:phospholipid/cholesterol/gamma-HCH transport system substrate-binding protein
VGGSSYPLNASFRSADGITVGTDVRLAGINVGTVTGLDLDPASYRAKVTFTVDGALQIPADSDAKIASESLLGGNYLEITPGASEDMLADGDEIVNTQGSVSLLNLLMRFGTGQ